MTPTKAMHPDMVEILNQEIDCAGNDASYYRMLVNKKHFNLLSILPPFPTGDWNYGRIAQAPENSSAFFAEPSRVDFPSIKPLWHAKSYDYLSFKIGPQLKSHVYVASSPQFTRPIIAKHARFEWDIGYYIAETQAYSWIEGSNIGPEFLGYLTEEGRVIGFLIEKLEGRHASISDLPACKAAVRKLHGLGILHKDLNKYNFLISERGAVLIDFETAERSDDREAMEAELSALEAQLLDESGIGGVTVEGEDDT